MTRHKLIVLSSLFAGNEILTTAIVSRAKPPAKDLTKDNSKYVKMNVFPELRQVRRLEKRDRYKNLSCRG